MLAVVLTLRTSGLERWSLTVTYVVLGGMKRSNLTASLAVDWDLIRWWSSAFYIIINLLYTIINLLYTIPGGDKQTVKQ